MYRNNFTEINTSNNNNQREQSKWLIILGLSAIGYYFFLFLPSERKEAREEIQQTFRENSLSPTDLDSKL